MAAPDTSVWLLAGYALALLAAAWGFDLMAARVSVHAAAWRNGQFRYDADRDAWLCPQDQWLHRESFDAEHRVMRYRAEAGVCNRCPVRSACTDSEEGREMSREVDVWPHSEAGRFHRGIACFVAALGVVMPLAMLIQRHSPADVLVLLGVAAVVGAGAVPLARHLWRTPVYLPGRPPPR